MRPTPCPDGLTRVFAAGEYAGAARKVLLAHKERQVYGLARPLGLLLAHSVRSAVSEIGLAGDIGCLLVPVPSHPTVVRTRTHDPLLRLAREAAREIRRDGTPVRIVRPLRVAQRPADQAGLSAARRRDNLGAAFRAAPPPAGTSPAVLLVDDIVTTGTTLRECQRVLEGAGWRVPAAVTVAATRRRTPARASAQASVQTLGRRQEGTPAIHVLVGAVGSNQEHE